MSKRRPPRTTGGKLSPELTKWLGTPRTCDACDETKDISVHTYTPKKSGWATTCKVCEALGVTGDGNTNVTGNVLTTGAVGEVIEEMYELAQSAKPNMERLEEIKQFLAHEVMSRDEEASFRLFVKIIQPLITNWVEPGMIHDDIIAGLLSKYPVRQIIATRYSAKSTLTGIWLAWRLYRDPFLKIMVISAGAKLASRMLRIVRQIYIAHCPLLEGLRPDDDCLDNAEQFQVPVSAKQTSGGASFTSLGRGSHLPGFRADLTVCDDIEAQSDDTPEKVQELLEALNEIHMINPKGEKIMLGTYQTEFSLYALLADLEDEEGNPVWETHRACMFEDDGELISSRWTAMFSDHDGMLWRRRTTERAWKLHIMLIADPSILNERPLKISLLPVVRWDAWRDEFPLKEEGMRAAPHLNTWSAPKGDEWYELVLGEERAPYVRTVMAVDPASGLAGRDAIGVAVIGLTRAGQAVIRHLEGVRGPDKQGNIDKVARIAKQFEVDHILVEELADGLFGDTLTERLGSQTAKHMMVEKVTTGGQQKGRRIVETLQPPMANRRIYICESVARSDSGGEFVNQLVRISYDGRTGKAKDHDDIVDALAHAIKNVAGDLVSHTYDNIANLRGEQMDDLRGLPLRFGGMGLGDSGDRQDSRSIHLGDPVTGNSMMETLLEEDEAIIYLEEYIEAQEKWRVHCLRNKQYQQSPPGGGLSQLEIAVENIKKAKERLVTLKELRVI